MSFRTNEVRRTTNTRIALSELVLCKDNVVSAHTSKKYGDVESELLSFSTSTLESGQWSTSRSEPPGPP